MTKIDIFLGFRGWKDDTDQKVITGGTLMPPKGCFD